jgi:CRISPR-associated protein Cas2
MAHTMNRTLYLVAYDITQQGRLAKVRHFLKGYSTGGQKSVYECFLTDAELRFVSGSIRELIEEEEDRVHVFTMDGRSTTHALGVAVQPQDPEYFYVG